MIKSQRITYDDSNLVEKAFYEYNTSKNILAYLMKQNNNNEQKVSEYFQETEKKFIYLEMLKHIILLKYNLKPELYNYIFDFDNEAINYEEITNEKN